MDPKSEIAKEGAKLGCKCLLYLGLAVFGVYKAMNAGINYGILKQLADTVDSFENHETTVDY